MSNETATQRFGWGTYSNKRKHPGYVVFERIGNEGVTRIVADDMTMEEAKTFAAECNSKAEQEKA